MEKINKASRYLVITEYNILPTGINIYGSYDSAANGLDNCIDLDYVSKHNKKLKRHIIKLSIESTTKIKKNIVTDNEGSIIKIRQ
jgi:hypothetical protein